MSDKKDDKQTFEPRIVAFFCNWCTYTAADLAGTARMAYAPNVRVVRIMCSGRLDPQFVLSAFREVQRVINEMTATIRALGPLTLEPAAINGDGHIALEIPVEIAVAGGGSHE
jgi:hypothetical protein